MSKQSKAEQTLITTFRQETEKLLKDELPPVERDGILDKLNKRWAFLNARSNFQEFIAVYKLKSLEPSEIFEVKRFMAEVFRDVEVTMVADEKASTLTVSVALDEGKLEGQFVVEPEEEPVLKPTFVAFPVCMSGDPGLVWIMGRADNVSEPEARIALNAIEAEFWETKKGIKLQKLRKPKTMATFIEEVPAGLLKNKGLKRHYKFPGVVIAADRGMSGSDSLPADASDASPADAGAA
jgi:hypothetical protein